MHCIHTEGSGCYGHNAADDVAADAALLARALPGRPVRVQWMREDEHMWEPYGPPMVTGVRATLDDSGSIASWQYEVWSNTHNARPGAAGDLLAAQHLAQPFRPSPPQPGSQPDGLGDRNSIPLYTLPNARVLYHFLPEMPLRVSALRSLGAYMNVFSIESFMDELAHAAGADPVVFRLKHMADGRARDVIHLAAEKFGWTAFERRPGRGRGFAFCRYKNQAGYAAMACEVEVRRDSGEVRLLRVVAAVDSGEVVNPDGIRNQIEGGIVQASSWTLSEEVTLRPHAHHQPRLGRLPDPALPAGAAAHRRVHRAAPGPALPGHRRGRAGTDPGDDRQCAGRRNRGARPAASAVTRAGQAGAGKLKRGHGRVGRRLISERRDSYRRAVGGWILLGGKGELSMALDKSPREDEISSARDQEFSEWAKTMRTTPARLSEAVLTVGIAPRKIRLYLRGCPAGDNAWRASQK